MQLSIRQSSWMGHTLTGIVKVTIVHIIVAILVGTLSETSTAETTEDLMAVGGIIDFGFLN